MSFCYTHKHIMFAYAGIHFTLLNIACKFNPIWTTTVELTRPKYITFITERLNSNCCLGKAKTSQILIEITNFSIIYCMFHQSIEIPKDKHLLLTCIEGLTAVYDIYDIAVVN